jgi:hypothetical protein
MEQVSQGKFSCDACGKVYRWKPELAGRRVKCKCSHVLTAPREEPGAPEDDITDGLYDLAEAEKQSARRQSSVSEGFRCPSCQSDLPLGAMACVKCGFDMRTGAASAPKLSLAPGMPAGAAAIPAGGKNALLAYGAPRRGLQQEDAGDNKLIDLYLPIGLIVFGLIGSFMQITQFSKVTYSVADAIPIIGISVIVNLVLTAIGCLAAIKMMDVAFGDPASAALKLCAIVIAPDGIARTISYLVGDTSGFTGWGLSLVMYYCLFSYLFDLDGGETLLLTGVIWTIRTWLGMFVTAILLSTLMSGFSGFGGLGGGIGSGKATLNVDVIAVEALERGNAKEAKGWLNESVNRVFSDIGRGEAVQIVDDLYKLGAKKVTALVYGPEGDTLIVELPSDKAKRKAIFAWEATFQTKYRGTATKDEGQDYLILDF